MPSLGIFTYTRCALVQSSVFCRVRGVRSCQLACFVMYAVCARVMWRLAVCLMWAPLVLLSRDRFCRRLQQQAADGGGETHPAVRHRAVQGRRAGTSQSSTRSPSRYVQYVTEQYKVAEPVRTARHRAVQGRRAGTYSTSSLRQVRECTYTEQWVLMSAQRSPLTVHRIMT